jgi:iron complex transport system substrate-binding protein
MYDPYPKRIVCLTEESTEILYLLGAEERIVGISAFTVRPERARKEKPVVSAFTSANIDQIKQLNPDLVVGFSDIQAEIAKRLIAEGIEVWITNQRSIDEILATIVRLGSLVGKSAAALELAGQLEANLEQAKEKSIGRTPKPRIYFEEWYHPMITGIRWVSELIEIAGGRDVFKDLGMYGLAKDRIIHDPNTVIDKDPDLIIGSWCGKKFRPEKVASRPGWENITAVKNNALFEMDSSIILQPGPAALSDGLEQLSVFIDGWYEKRK